VSELAALESGKVLAFARRAAEPAALLVAGSEMFRAQPARVGNMRAARLLERLPEPETGTEHSAATEKTK
jgi:flagellar motor switch protein FliM